MRQTLEGNGSQIHANPFKSVQILLLVNFNLELYREEIPGNVVNCLMNLTNYHHLLINELGNCSTCMNLRTPILIWWVDYAKQIQNIFGSDLIGTEWNELV